MLNETVASLNYKLFLDAQGLTKGTKELNRDFRTLTKSMKSVVTDTEKMDNEFKVLQEAVKNEVPGALATLNRRLEQTGKTMNKNGRIVDSNAKKWKTFSTNVKSSVLNFKNFVAIAAGSAAIRGISSTIEKVDELSKLARQLGVSMEFLTATQYAAQQELGLSADEAAKALTKMARRVEEARKGSGEALAIFEKYGISVKQFQHLNVEQTFEELGRQFKDVTSEQEQLVIGTKLFDDELARMFQLMVKDKNELNELTEEGKKLGAVLTSVDATNMEAAANSMGQMSTSFAAFTRQFVTAFGPSITAMLDSMTRIVNSLPGLSSTDKDGKVSKLTLGDVGAGIVSQLADAGEVIGNVATGEFSKAGGQVMDTIKTGAFIGNISDAADARYAEQTQLQREAAHRQKQMATMAEENLRQQRRTNELLTRQPKPLEPSQ